MTRGKAKTLRVSDAGLGIATWAPEEENRFRPPCVSATGKDRDQWTSNDAGEKAKARVACIDKCPLAVRMQCLKQALGSGCEDAVFGGHNFTSAGGRKLARQELERYEAGQEALT